MSYDERSPSRAGSLPDGPVLPGGQGLPGASERPGAPEFATAVQERDRDSEFESGSDDHTTRSLQTAPGYQEPTYDDREPYYSSEATQRFDTPQTTFDTTGPPPLPPRSTKDRVLVNLIWDGLLLVGAGVIALLLYRATPGVFSGEKLQDLLLAVAIIGLVALAFGLSTRSAAPNLAVGPIAVGAALLFALQAQGKSLYAAGGIAVGAGAAVGLVIALLVVGLQVPAWAASLGAGLGVVVWASSRKSAVRVPDSFLDPSSKALWAVVAVAGIGLLGGIVGLFPPIRRAIGGYRSTADPASRPSAGAGFMTALALIISGALAGLGGVLLALVTRGASVGGTGRELAFELTALAVGAVLLGGTSAFGRRGGVLGTLLVVAIFAMVPLFPALASKWFATPLALAAAGIVVGLVITRVVEWLGKPAESSTFDDETPGWQTDDWPPAR